MESELSNSAKRVQDFLSAMGFSFDVKELPGSTRTAQEAADSIGCTVAQIAKSLVLGPLGSHQDKILKIREMFVFSAPF
jgi:prolyl-tRNA editing enzyme YbaK/EbsC (Cys-tRNA(Pro) deacylase)